MKRDLAIEESARAGKTSKLTSRLAHHDDEPAAPSRSRGKGRSGAASATRPPARAKPADAAQPPAGAKPAGAAQPPAGAKPATAANPAREAPSATPPAEVANGAPGADGHDGVTDEHYSAPDIAENEGMVSTPKPKPTPKSKSRNRRHGRR
jgi:hypothetical protein